VEHIFNDPGDQQAIRDELNQQKIPEWEPVPEN
jgi:hypothetical protein